MRGRSLIWKLSSSHRLSWLPRREAHELLSLPTAELAGALAAPARAFVAGFYLNSDRGRHWHPDRHTLNSKTISAWSGARHRQCDADDSQSGAVWVSDSVTVHRRHWSANGNRRVGPLFV